MSERGHCLAYLRLKTKHGSSTDSKGQEPITTLKSFDLSRKLGAARAWPFEVSSSR